LNEEKWLAKRGAVGGDGVAVYKIEIVATLSGKTDRVIV
jgi:hypothetical protein